MKQVLMFIALLCICGMALAKEQNTQQSCQSQNCQLILYEGFENGFGPKGWSSALWETCDPSVCPPPDSARSGDSCAASLCCGLNSQTTSLVGPLPGVALPPVDTGEFILVKWWHCFWNIVGANQGESNLYVRVIGESWVKKWGPEKHTNPKWHESPLIDLTNLAGNTIQFKFEKVAILPLPAWYVDDIRVEVCGLGCYAGADKEICEGDAVEFLDTYVQYGVPPYIYSWSPCQGLSDCNILYPVANPESTTAYVLTVTDDSLNTATDTVVITVQPLPPLTLRDTTILVDSQLCIDPGEFDSCHWNSGETTCEICTTFSETGDYQLWLTVFENQCSTTDTVVVTVSPCTDVPPDESLLPTQFALQQNYPNPFNPVTTISYTLPKKSHVTIVVFNILEQKIRTLVNEAKAAGAYQVVWDGTDQSGKPVASGVYFYKFQAGDCTEARKMLLLK